MTAPGRGNPTASAWRRRGLVEAAGLMTATAKGAGAPVGSPVLAAEPSAMPVGAWIVIALLAVLLGAGGWYWRRARATAAPGDPAGEALLPTAAEVTGWSDERLREVVAALFEYEGLRIEVRPADSGGDLVLRRPDEARPRAWVRCQAASAGLATGKAVRTFFGTTVMEGVNRACFVSAGGFTTEARQFAREHRLELIGGEDLLRRLKAMPRLALMRALAPGG